MIGSCVRLYFRIKTNFTETCKKNHNTDDNKEESGNEEPSEGVAVEERFVRVEGGHERVGKETGCLQLRHRYACRHVASQNRDGLCG